MILAGDGGLDGDGGVDSKKFLAGLDIEISALFYSQDADVHVSSQCTRLYFY